jgi:uncharacterized protein with FMN-binding domain
MGILCLPGSNTVKNRALAYLYFFILPALFTVCSMASDNSDAYTPGTYTGSVVSYGGALTVTATFSANAIEKIEVVEHHDSSSRQTVQQALSAIPQEIIALNSLDVDIVSGASVTSRRIIDAVDACAEQARLVPHNVGDQNRWRFINNSGYTFNVTTAGITFELRPGGNQAVSVESGDPVYALSGVFYNVSSQKHPNTIIFVNG